MTPEQILNRMVRLMEQSADRKNPRFELSPEPADLVEEYFTDLWRPRLSGNAFLVWAYLCHRAEPESRIAGVSYRDLRAGTGIRGNRSLHQALSELDRLGYCIPTKTPTGPGQPKNYKIPEHIGSSRFPHAEAMRLCAQADRPRKRGNKAARILREAAREMTRAAAEQSPDHTAPVGPRVPSPALDLPDPAALNLDQEIERLEKEVEEIGKALLKEK